MSDLDRVSTRAIAGRLYWTLLGPMMLMLTAIYIAFEGVGWFTFADLVYFILLAGLILARWLEFRGGKPLTDMGEPATWSHFRRYASGVIVFGIILWVLANAVSNGVSA
jgi:hypothetical protein